MTRYFEYATDAVEYLKAKDKKLGAAIDAVGVVRREMDEDDLFTAIVHQIIGQQISTAAQATIWNRMRERLGEVTPSAVCAATEEGLQACGITFTKARYIKSCAEKVASGQFDLDAVREMGDAEAIAALSSLEGVGVWTAEMLLLFCLGRPDILSYGDLAIHRGMRMVYHHRKVTREMFERYRLPLQPLRQRGEPLFVGDIEHERAWLRAGLCAEKGEDDEEGEAWRRRSRDEGAKRVRKKPSLAHAMRLVCQRSRERVVWRRRANAVYGQTQRGECRAC